MKTFVELKKQNKELKEKCLSLAKQVKQQELDLEELHSNYKEFISKTGEKRDLVNECDYLRKRVNDLELLLKYQIQHNIVLKGKLNEKD